jgi:hypothetical protein
VLVCHWGMTWSSARPHCCTRPCPSRAALVGLLADGGPAAAEVLLVGTRLIPDAIGFPGLRRSATLAGALHAVEAELVHRARLLEAEDAPDFASHRHQHPDDPLPALVLVADGVSLEQAGRLTAILAQGPRSTVDPCLVGIPGRCPNSRRRGCHRRGRRRLQAGGRPKDVRTVST